jgi:hypothetical protein
MSNSTAADEESMLKRSEREKLQDCLLLVRSAFNILTGIREEVVPGLAKIQKCFLEVDRKLSQLLGT